MIVTVCLLVCLWFVSGSSSFRCTGVWLIPFIRPVNPLAVSSNMEQRLRGGTRALGLMKPPPFTGSPTTTQQPPTILLLQQKRHWPSNPTSSLQPELHRLLQLQTKKWLMKNTFYLFVSCQKCSLLVTWFWFLSSGCGCPLVAFGTEGKRLAGAVASEIWLGTAVKQR